MICLPPLIRPYSNTRKNRSAIFVVYLSNHCAIANHRSFNPTRAHRLFVSETYNNSPCCQTFDHIFLTPKAKLLNCITLTNFRPHINPHIKAFIIEVTNINLHNFELYKRVGCQQAYNCWMITPQSVKLSLANHKLLVTNFQARREMLLTCLTIDQLLSAK